METFLRPPMLMYRNMRKIYLCSRQFRTRAARQSLGLGASRDEQDYGGKLNKFYQDNKMQKLWSTAPERISSQQNQQYNYSSSSINNSAQTNYNNAPGGHNNSVRHKSASLGRASGISGQSPPGGGLGTTNGGEKASGVFSAGELAKIRALQTRDNLKLEKRRLYQKLTLSSYLQVCIDVGQINRAFNILVSCSSPKKNALVDVNHYNIVLRGWAKLNSSAQIIETRMHMIRNNIEPNAETFAYVLLSHSNKSSKQSTNSCKKIIQEIKTRDIGLKTLFQSAYLNPSERKSVKNLIRCADPKYDDTFCAEPIEDNCKLTANIRQLEVVPYEFAGSTNLAKIMDWSDTQRVTEWKSSIIIKSIADPDIKPKAQEEYSKLWEKYQEIWRKAINKSLDESFVALQEQCASTDKIHIYPYLCSIDRNMMVHLMLDEIENSANFSSFSISTSYLHQQFGHKVMDRYIKAKAIADGSNHEKQKIYTDYLKEYCKNPEMMGRMNSREFIQQKALETKNYSIYKDRLSPVEEWPHHVISSVGKFLYATILREVKFDPNAMKRKEINMNNLIHAFYTAYFQIDSSHKIKEEFRAHRDFVNFHLKACSHRLKFDYSYLPTLCPPLPWLSHGFGGYLANKTELVRVSNSSAEQSYLVKENTNYQKLYPTLDSLNAIGLCPWIVNKEILDLVIELFRAGGDTELTVPLDETKMEIEAPILEEKASKADRILYNRAKKKYEQKRREMYSLWRDCLYRLSIANHFRDRVFWFPHNVDFRGRAYPIPPHFNHLGADLARSLLLFARGEPLGEKGLDWLKIHLINLEGKMKKASMEERLEYANSILHLEVLDSADNPWDGRKWWTKNENPWQVLACCKEIAKAIRSKNFRQYISHFPVHQDGSCNGLQHYAALGRDRSGALAVNLIPSQKPQDVYSRVVDIVEKMRRKDAANGVKVAERLEGFIERKVIKQTVMTTVYGVTRYGARQQIARQLAYKGYPDSEIWSGAQYLTSKTFESIGQMFNKSRLIQDWLNDCAYTIASRYKQPVSWDTPLGFYVVQPYTMPSSNSIAKTLSSSIGTDQVFYSDPLARLNAPKQKSAFPPNYIHSLDSSHMMLTSLYSQRKGITFVSVHDCYWTHPSTVDIMNRICREQFVALHSEPLLKQLAEQFIKKFEQNETSDESEISKRLEGSKFKVVAANDRTYSKWKKEDEHAKTQVKALNASQREGTNVSVSSLLIGMPIYENDKLVNEDLKKLMQEEVDNIANNVATESGETSEVFTPDTTATISDLPNRDTLVDMYESSLRASKGKARAIFSQVPKTGELNLDSVLESKYFFS